MKGKNGKIYLTDSIGSAVTAFDPKTREFENFQIGDGALYPHTVRADTNGVIWFSIAFSDQIGRFDPATKDMRVINLPQTPSLSIPGASIPYGVAVRTAHSAGAPSRGGRESVERVRVPNRLI